MAPFWAELKRRGVIRAGITYVIVAWVIAQVAALVADSFLAPVWVMQMVIALLVVGLPVSLIVAWVFDLTRDGIIRTEDDDAEAQWTARNKHASFLIAGVVVVVAATLYMTWPPEEDVSIAVLPFEDRSPAGDQAYFGNGIADQLRLELQRLDGLRVEGQTSSNYFKHNDMDPQLFGESINVDWILQGSIRKDEDRIRITAQLVNVADGFAIWSEPYDHELAGIFAIQEDIATRVAGELGVRLGVGGINSFNGAGT